MTQHSRIRRVVVAEVPEPPGATWSNCLMVGDEVILSGITAHPARDGAGEVLSTEAQTERIFARIQTLLHAAETDMQHIVKLVVYLTEISDKTVVGQVRHRWLREPYPASTLVGVNALVFPELTVEIDAWARLP